MTEPTKETQTITVDIGQAVEQLQANPELAAMMMELVAPTAARDIERIEAVCNDMLASLRLIEGMRGLTLIAPSLGEDGDHGHQIGANKAFEQTADIAKAAIAKATPVSR